MSVIETRGLRKSYRGINALRGVDLSIADGATGLLGPNGAGKTTFIKACLGLVHIDGGSVRVLDMQVARRDRHRLRERVGYLPEVDCHIPGFNAVQYVAYAGQLAGLPRRDAMQRAHETLDYVGLGEARYRPVETFSAGMRQRAKLAQCIVHDPKLIFLDEPTNGLDPRGRDEMLALARDLAQSRGISVVFSSHLLPDVEAVCDRVVIIGRGRVLAADTIETLRGAGSRGYRVRARGTAEALEAAERDLDKLGLLVHPATPYDGAGADPGHGPAWRSQVPDAPVEAEWIVETPDGATPEPIFRTAAALGLQVRRLERERTSLEQVFLDALKEGDNHADL